TTKEDVPLQPAVTLNPNFGGCADMVAVNDDKIIAAFDSGNILLLNAATLEEFLGELAHDGPVLQLVLTRSQRRLASCSLDFSIKIWDVENLTAQRIFNQAHAHHVHNVGFKSDSEDILMSCGQDRQLLTWDLRLQAPASKFSLLSSVPTAVCW